MPPVLHGQAAPRRLGWPGGALPASLRRAQGQAVEPQQRAALVAAKLNALVDTTAGPADRRSVAYPGGAALTGDDGLWVLGDSLGGALALAWKLDAGPLNLVVEDGDAGVLARRATQFAEPPVIWRVEGTTLERAVPAPLVSDPPLSPGVAALAEVLTAAGADPVVEHGRLIGEVLGLEVARAVIGDDGEPHLEVGVGRFDREANALLTGDQPDAERLAAVVTFVRRHRRAEAEPHPLQQLAAARRLRAQLVADPRLVGADLLVPMASTIEAPDLRTPWPAPASGIDVDGAPVVVVASVGVDLDLVPAAADARLADGRAARLVLALAPRDAHPVTVALAAALEEPAEIRFVDLS